MPQMGMMPQMPGMNGMPQMNPMMMMNTAGFPADGNFNGMGQNFNSDNFQQRS